jgi:hypothetical protein
MDLYDLYQDGDEVGLALKELKQAIQFQKEKNLISRLSHYLEANTNSQLLEMWEQIQKEENPSIIIDYVGFVVVRERYEFDFSCKYFIELINLE